jgi:hypothetical protein
MEQAARVDFLKPRLKATLKEVEVDSEFKTRGAGH